MQKQLYNKILPIVFFIFLLLVIEIILNITSIPEYLFPKPSIVFEELIKNYKIIFFHLKYTVFESLLGFVIGNIFAIIFAVLFSQFLFLQKTAYPIVVSLQAIPIIAIAPFINIWFGTGLFGKAVLAALICYFPAVVISTNGFSQINKDVKNYIETIKCSKWDVFFKIKLPSAIPSIVSALQISATLCMLGAIVAELSGAEQGVGYLILISSYNFDTKMLFAILFITGISAILIFKMITFLGNFYVTKYEYDVKKQ